MDKTDKLIWNCINRLKEIREKQKLSQEGLADLAKISHSAISMAERRKNSPTLKTLIKLCDALDVKLSDILKEIGK